MNMPFDPLAWRELENRAAQQLHPLFAENVLRAARKAAADEDRTGFRRSFAVSAITATLCLSALLFVHARNTREMSAQHLAAWQEISADYAVLEPTP
ncbi:MAG TPA: hypothetical protein VFT72_08815 [Opitutaceae bacterium]|nr:hypothetical protein [Opitutaceae bacterium]